ncbi:MAG: DUF2934 domain-containing protein [Gammaproteobacteria bacterium]|nr:DUF2934 domain-containing protein [Gammaproteobacteria bacterium]
MVKKKAASKKTASKKATTKKAVTKKSTAKKAVTKTAASKKKATSKKAVSKKKTSAKKSPAVTYINNEQRYLMVQEAAYHLSEKQNFEPGKDMDNWLFAEMEIEALMKKKNIKVK